MSSTTILQIIPHTKAQKWMCLLKKLTKSFPLLLLFSTLLVMLCQHPAWGQQSAAERTLLIESQPAHYSFTAPVSGEEHRGESGAVLIHRRPLAHLGCETSIGIINSSK